MEQSVPLSALFASPLLASLAGKMTREFHPFYLAFSTGFDQLEKALVFLKMREWLT